MRTISNLVVLLVHALLILAKNLADNKLDQTQSSNSFLTIARLIVSAFNIVMAIIYDKQLAYTTLYSYHPSQDKMDIARQLSAIITLHSVSSDLLISKSAAEQTIYVEHHV